MYYADFFYLKEAPFSIAPNPRYLFMSDRHREALAHLLYGVVNGNGFVALTGEVGTGKTTLCNCLLDQLPDNIDLALVLNPRMSANELLATLCDDLGIGYPEGATSVKVLLDALTAHLLKVHADGRNTVLLIDEAQNLSIEVLEQIRLLTNLETHETKLLQIILVGQPELNQLLAQKNLRQLNQRITARYHIESLSLSECFAYIEHRLRVAGCSDPVFTKSAVKKIFQLSGGIPRLINIVCDRAMLGAYTLGVRRVGPEIVTKAAREVLLPSPDPALWHSYWTWLAALVLISVVSAFSASGFREKLPEAGFDAGPAASGEAVDDPALGSQPRVYREMFGNIVPAAEAGFGSESLPAKGETPGRAGVVSGAVRQSPAGSETAEDSSQKSPTVERPRIRFLEQISNPDLTLNAALPQLFRQWSIRNEPGSRADFCGSARRSGLRCLVQSGTWNYLLTLNRPATLEFTLQNGANRYATLIDVEGDLATFTFLNDDPQSFPISEVLPFWQGQFAMLWKPPIPDTARLRRGYSNPEVVWLRETLQSIRGEHPGNPGSAFFDQALEDQVIAFQSEHGLDPDGKVGSDTILLLSSLGNSPEVPRLTAKRK